MKEQLNNKIDIIKNLLNQNTLSGADLLMDLARQYSAQEDLEDEVILLKFQFQNASLEKQNKITQQLLSIADRIIEQYDEVALQEVHEKEKRLVETMELQQGKHSVVVEAKNIEKFYRSSRFHFKLDHLELRLGEITGLVGENATGKSTLFNILAGEISHDKGELRYPLFQKTKRLNWISLKKHIAYVPQELPPWIGSLKDNLRYEAALRGKNGTSNEKALRYIIQRLGLADHEDNSWRQLSGGYKLRFALAKALIWEPQLLILDEPLANLDIKTQLLVLNDLRDLAKSLRRPMAIFISSQHIHELESVTDQMLFMRAGKLEHLGARSTYGEDRLHNTFEINCSLSYTELVEQLQGFPHEKIWYNGMSYIITTDPTITDAQLLQHLINQNIKIDYFRNISRSVKTRFYETDME